MITLFSELKQIYFLVVKIFEHSDMRAEVDIYQSNQAFRLPEILSIQNRVILFKSNNLVRVKMFKNIVN